MIRLLYWENSSVWRDNKIKRKCVCVFTVVSVETPFNKLFLSHSVTNRPILNTCLPKTKKKQQLLTSKSTTNTTPKCQQWKTQPVRTGARAEQHWKKVKQLTRSCSQHNRTKRPFTCTCITAAYQHAWTWTFPRCKAIIVVFPTATYNAWTLFLGPTRLLYNSINYCLNRFKMADI